ncbi:MAG: hypothetical protein Q4P06_02580 [Actinomycetaceae bacterium]|nr:hypothetical protein [Actinomycetaceae bacterium]
MSTCINLAAAISDNRRHAQQAYEQALAAGAKTGALKSEADALIKALETAHQAQRLAEATLDAVVQLVENTNAARSVDATTSELLSNAGGYSTQEANRIIMRAKRRLAHPKLHDAWARNEISNFGLNKSITTVEDLKEHLPETEYAKLYNEVADLAQAKLDNKTFNQEINTLANQYWAKVDNQPTAEEKLHPKRGLYFKRIAGGWRINATVTTPVGETIRNALGDLARKARIQQSQTKQPPTPIQARLADAFAQLSANYVRTHLVDPRKLHPLNNLAEDADSEQIRLAIVRNYDGRYDCGRDQRFATAQLRALVLARDGGCLFPHCTAIATTCEIGHVKPWKFGGRTDLGNLVALCPHHHWIFDQTGAQPQHRYTVVSDGKNPPRILPPPGMAVFGSQSPVQLSPGKQSRSSQAPESRPPPK